jgi:hypothetical protein
MTSSNQQQKQQQRASGSQHASHLPSNMDIGSPFFNSVTFGDNYRNQQSIFHVSMGPYVMDGQTAPTVPSTFAPWNTGQQYLMTPPLTPQVPTMTASAHIAHPSDIFSSLDEAMAAIPPPSWCCPANDATIPSTDQDRQQWVQKLLAAVNNVTNIQGKQGDNFKKRWNHPVTGPSNYYLPLDKLILCWKIEDLVERMHRVGPSVLHSFDDNFWEAAKRTGKWTFQYRMDRIIGLLTISKTRCDTLLGGGSLQSIVSNPGERAVATKLQSKQNEKRGAMLKMGRAAKKQSTSAHEG